MRKLDDETRRAIATGWNPHVQTMREYAASVGVSERAIRKYRARFSTVPPETVPVDRAVVPLQVALDGLQVRLDGLKAVLDGLRAAADVARAALAACRTVPVNEAPTVGDTASPAHQAPAPEQAQEQVEPAVVHAQPAPRVRPVRVSCFSDFQ